MAGILASAPRGGVLEEIDGRARPLMLRNAEIERLEDRHGSAFALLDGFAGRGDRPAVGAVRDIVALGLVGGGMSEAAAAAVIRAASPAHNDRFYMIAQATLLVAFMPDAGGDPAEDPPARAQKKTPQGGTCGA